MGHIISEKGIAVDLHKIKDISEWLVQKDVYDIRPFMGLTSYYRSFIEGFSRMDYPINSLQKKGVKFLWSLKCHEIFENIKKLLTMAQILKVVGPYKNYMVYTDASKEGLGGVLNVKKDTWYVTNIVN